MIKITNNKKTNYQIDKPQKIKLEKDEKIVAIVSPSKISLVIYLIVPLCIGGAIFITISFFSIFILTELLIAIFLFLLLWLIYKTLKLFMLFNFGIGMYENATWWITSKRIIGTVGLAKFTSTIPFNDILAIKISENRFLSISAVKLTLKATTLKTSYGEKWPPNLSKLNIIGPLKYKEAKELQKLIIKYLI